MNGYLNEFSLQDFIRLYHSSSLTINSIHLLYDDKEKFTVAISWNNSKTSKFKVFKDQSYSDLKLFEDFDSELNKCWNPPVSGLLSPQLIY